MIISLVIKLLLIVLYAVTYKSNGLVPEQKSCEFPVHVNFIMKFLNFPTLPVRSIIVLDTATKMCASAEASDWLFQWTWQTQGVQEPPSLRHPRWSHWSTCARHQERGGPST